MTRRRRFLSYYNASWRRTVGNIRPSACLFEKQNNHVALHIWRICVIKGMDSVQLSRLIDLINAVCRVPTSYTLNTAQKSSVT